MLIYIAGPMSGVVDHNFPAFHAAAKMLRGCCFDVINPAELHPDSDKVQRPWAYYMRKDIAELVKCDSIFMLDGWQSSKGANLEKHLALELGLQVIYQRYFRVAST